MGNSSKVLFLAVVLLGVGGLLIYSGLKSQPLGLRVLPTPNSSIQNPSPLSTTLPVSSLGSTSSATIAGFREFGEVTKVVDGDTIDVKISGQVKRLRYIGVNTPETVDPRRPVQCFGKEASDENKKLVSGKTVYLEKDVSETDKYGRLLRLVYLPLENGQLLFVNDYLVREGYAQVDTFPPDVKFAERFKEAENEARIGNKGLWSKCKSSN